MQISVDLVVRVAITAWLPDLSQRRESLSELNRVVSLILAGLSKTREHVGGPSHRRTDVLVS